MWDQVSLGITLKLWCEDNFFTGDFTTEIKWHLQEHTMKVFLSYSNSFNKCIIYTPYDLELLRIQREYICHFYKINIYRIYVIPVLLEGICTLYIYHPFIFCPSAEPLLAHMPSNISLVFQEIKAPKKQKMENNSL